MKLFSRLFLLLFVATVLTFPQTALAQQQSAASNSSGGGSGNAISTILLSGLVGGLLGLSTLSFYNKPEDHVKNIPLGAAAGMIFATLFISYNVATDPNLGARNTPPMLMIAPDPVQEEVALVFTKSF